MPLAAPAAFLASELALGLATFVERVIKAGVTFEEADAVAVVWVDGTLRAVFDNESCILLLTTVFCEGTATLELFWLCAWRKGRPASLLRRASSNLCESLR